eukprot:COSAG02_NODE_395_length_23127_cov_130.205663_9_plen_1340_part_00
MQQFHPEDELTPDRRLEPDTLPVLRADISPRHREPSREYHSAPKERGEHREASSSRGRIAGNPIIHPDDLDVTDEDRRHGFVDWHHCAVNGAHLILSSAAGEDKNFAAHGAHSSVHRAVWKRSIPVAVKIPDDQTSRFAELTTDGLTDEMQLFLDLTHPHIESCYGILQETIAGDTGRSRGLTKNSIVTELCQTCLREFLSDGSKWVNLSPAQIDLQKYTILTHVSLGLQKLHEMGVLHRDVKCKNVLLDGPPGVDPTFEHSRWKICDFGTAAVLKSHFGVTDPGTDLHITATNASPELLDGIGIGLPTDIFSFGVLMWEVFTRQKAWHWFDDARSSIDVCKEVLVKNSRPKIPHGLAQSCATQFRLCVARQPHLRPTAKAMGEWLEDCRRNKLMAVQSGNALVRERHMLQQANKIGVSIVDVDSCVLCAKGICQHWSKAGRYSIHTTWLAESCYPADSGVLVQQMTFNLKLVAEESWTEPDRTGSYDSSDEEDAEPEPEHGPTSEPEPEGGSRSGESGSGEKSECYVPAHVQDAVAAAKAEEEVGDPSSTGGDGGCGGKPAFPAAKLRETVGDPSGTGGSGGGGGKHRPLGIVFSNQWPKVKSIKPDQVAAQFADYIQAGCRLLAIDGKIVDHKTMKFKDAVPLIQNRPLTLCFSILRPDKSTDVRGGQLSYVAAAAVQAGLECVGLIRQHEAAALKVDISEGVPPETAESESVAVQNHEQGVLDELRATLNVQDEKKLLGKGATAIVYAGEYKFPGKPESPVAYKVYRMELVGELKHRIQSEVRFGMSLRHDNLSQIYGLVTLSTRAGIVGKSTALVMELAHLGSLDQALQETHKAISWSQRVQWLRDIAEGMAHLHQLKPDAIIHRDLKSQNVLLAQDDAHLDRTIARITDYGLAAAMETIGTTRSSRAGNTGTLRWKAPETFAGKFSPQSDVFAFAITAFEVVARCIPFADESDGEITRKLSLRFDPKNDGGVKGQVRRKEERGQTREEALAETRLEWFEDHPIESRRPDLSTTEEGCSPVLTALIQSCWADDPGERPSCSDCGKVLQELYVQLEPPVVAALDSAAKFPEPEFSLSEGKEYHFFICHHQGSGGDQSNLLSDKLTQLGYSVWYDNNQNAIHRNLLGMQEGVRKSMCLLIFLSGRKESDGQPDRNGEYEGTFTRWFCHEEMATAHAARLRCVGVKETDERHGTPDFALERERALKGGERGEGVHEKAPQNLHLLDDVVFTPFRREKHEVSNMLEEIVKRAQDVDCITLSPFVTDKTVQSWLEELKLGQYAARIVEDEGYDDLEYFLEPEFEESDIRQLAERVQMKRPHSMKFIKMWKQLKETSSGVA